METKIIDKIVKLFRLAQSSNPHEAAVAAARAAELMAEYKLDEATIRSSSDKPTKRDPIEICEVGEKRRFKQNWRGNLLGGIAKAFNCMAYWHKTKNSNYETVSSLKLVGRTGDIQAVTYTFSWLEQEVIRLSNTTVRPPMTAAQVNAWKNAFRVGAAREIAERMVAKQTEVYKTSTSTALAVIKNDEREVNDFVEEQVGPLKNTKQTKLRDYDGYRSGVQAGREVNLDGGSRGLNAAPDRLES